MALTINRQIIPQVVTQAHASGLITAESSSTVALYQISRYWRELFQKATRQRSDALPQWTEKEKATAQIIKYALLFLAMEECQDVEQLLSDTINAGTFERLCVSSEKHKGNTNRFLGD